MALSSQKQVMAGLDMKAGRAVKQIAARHERDVVRPIRAVIGKAKGNKDLLRRLNATLFKRMDETALVDAMTEDMVSSALIGRVTATPRERKGRSDEGAGKGRRDIGTKGRRVAK